MTTETTAQPAPSLPRGWSVEFRSAAGICTITLADQDGEQREVSFCKTQPPAGHLLARTLEEIEDPQLREAAERVLSTHYGRVATAQAHADAFASSLPQDLREDLEKLLARTLGCCSSGLSIDPDSLAVTLTLAARGAASGTLLTQLRAWQQADGVPDDQLRLEIDEEPGTLTAVLTGDSAADFLTWLHRCYVEIAAPADNAERAQRAEQALAAYRRAALGVPTVALDPDRDAVAELIAALLHLGRRHGLNYEDVHSHGRGLFERQEDQEDDDAVEEHSG